MQESMNSEKASWKEFRSLLASDRRRIEKFLRRKFGFTPCLLIFDPSYLCIWLCRVSRFFWCLGKPQWSALVRRLNILLTGLDVHGRCEIGPGVLVPAPNGVNLCGKIGSNFTILSLGGIGVDLKEKDIGAGVGAPILGDNIVLHQFSIVLGPFRVGTNSQLNPGSLATFNVPEGARLEVPCRYQPGQTPPVQEKLEERKECPHQSWKITWSHLAQDNERYLETLFRSSDFKKNRQSILKSILSNHFIAIALYRISHQLNRNGWEKLSQLVFWANCLINKVTLFPDSCVDGGLVLPHPAGVIFRGTAKKNLSLFPNSICSTLKVPSTTDIPGPPALGENVLVGSHSGILGSFSVGSETRLGMKTRILQSTRESALVFYRKASLGKIVEGNPATPNDTNSLDDSSDLEKDVSLESGDASTLFSLLKKDLAGLKAFAAMENPVRSWFWFLFPSFFCVLMFRLSHSAWKKGWLRLAYCFWWINYYVTGADLAPSSKVGGGLCIPYPAGVSVNCVAGENLTLMGQSGIGPFFKDGNLHHYWDEVPVVEDNVFIGHHSGVYGQVKIGRQVHLDPGCIIMEDIPENSYCAETPPEVKNRARAR